VTIMRLLRAVGVAGMCLIVLLSLVPGAYRPHTGAPGDVEHLLAYGLTAAALALGWRSPFQIAAIVLGLLVLASGLEVAQLFVPGRGADGVTALVSGLGGLCGVVLGAGLLRAVGLQLKEADGGAPAPRARVHSS
jgi:hypothetical protein